MAADPVGHPLPGPGLAIDVTGGSERGDEQLHCPGEARHRIDHVDGVAGEVDEHLLAGGMVLTHCLPIEAVPGG